jgi:hypothetical protein
VAPPIAEDRHRTPVGVDADAIGHADGARHAWAVGARRAAAARLDGSAAVRQDGVAGASSATAA